MFETMNNVFTWQGMQNHVSNYCKNCHECQLCKTTGKKKYGLLPEKEGELTRWSCVNVDLWGPKSIHNKNGYIYELHVMSMVDPVTGWVEFCQLYGPPTAYRCQQILDSCWLARYPRPKEIGMDNGKEFQGVFTELCDNMGLKKKTSHPWNPQSNSILERIHQVLGDGLQTFDLENMDIDESDEDSFDTT